MYQSWMWLLISILILKIIAIGISRGTPPVRPICHSDLYLCTHINKVPNTSQPIPGFMNTRHTCIQPRHIFTYLSVFLCMTRHPAPTPTPHPAQPDPILTIFGRSDETSRGVCGGLVRPETGKRTSKSASNPKASHKSSKWALVWDVKHTCKTYVSLIKP